MMNDDFSTIKPEEEKYYSIDDIVELYGVEHWTIRLWANRFGMLEHITDGDGSLLFTSKAVEQIGAICCMAKKRMTLEDAIKCLESEKC